MSPLLGVTKPVIYHYLGNKDQVLLNACEAVCRNCAKPPTRRDANPVTARSAEIFCAACEVTMDDFGDACPDRRGNPVRRRPAEFPGDESDIDKTMRAMIEDAVADDRSRSRIYA